METVVKDEQTAYSLLFQILSPRPPRLSAEEVAALAERGWLDVLTDQEFEALHRYHEWAQWAARTERRLEQVHRELRRKKVWAWLRLADVTDLVAQQRQLQATWEEERRQRDYFRARCSPTQHYGKNLLAYVPAANQVRVGVTPQGKQALAGFLFSPAFHESQFEAGRLADGLERFHGLVEDLQRFFKPDPRLYLAAALLVFREEDLPARQAKFAAANRWLVEAGWSSYDRLIPAAWLALSDRDLADDRHRWREAGQALQKVGFSPSDYTRHIAAQLTFYQAEADLGEEVAWLGLLLGQIRRQGWSLADRTEPLAARLRLVRETPAQVTEGLEQIFRVIRDLDPMQGQAIATAATILRCSNAFFIPPSQDMFRRTSPYREIVRRYYTLCQLWKPLMDAADPDVAALRRAQGYVLAAILAMMPGSPRALIHRVVQTAQHLSALGYGPCSDKLAVLLMELGCPAWRVADQFVYELGCLCPVADPMSIYYSETVDKPGVAVIHPDAARSTPMSGIR